MRYFSSEPHEKGIKDMTINTWQFFNGFDPLTRCVIITSTELDPESDFQPFAIPDPDPDPVNSGMLTSLQSCHRHYPYRVLSHQARGHERSLSTPR